MGGTNSDTINGLRVHNSNGDAHIHDDSKGLKFSISSKDFKKQVESAVTQLDKTKGDGMIRIKGKTANDLCLVKDGNVFFTFLMDSRSVKTKLLNFAKGC